MSGAPVMAEARLPLLRDYRPEAPLVYGQGGWVNQGDFLAAAAALARQLPEGRHALNLCSDRYHFMLGFCAALLRGVTTLLPANRQVQTLAELVGEYPGAFALVDEPQATGCPQVAVARLACADPAPAQSPTVAAEALAVTAFTSGSTGRPLPNAKRWASLCGTARLLAGRFAAGPRPPAIVATVPCQHMYGLEMTAMMALQGRCRLHARHPFYPEDIAAALAECAAPRLLVTTPVHLRALIGARCALPPTDRVVSATAPLEPSLAAAMEACSGGAVQEIYGCTEAGSIATRWPAQGDEWQLLEGMALRPAPAGVEVIGPQLAQPVPLQDQLALLDGGRFRLLGRAADLINVGGKRASLADLNRRLLEVDGVEDAVVFVPDDGQRPAALVVSGLSERQISEQLARRIDPVLLPRPLRIVAQIPRNETGKVARADLLQALRRTGG